MSVLPKELIREFIRKQNFTSTDGVKPMIYPLSNTTIGRESLLRVLNDEVLLQVIKSL